MLHEKHLYIYSTIMLREKHLHIYSTIMPHEKHLYIIYNLKTLYILL